MRASDGLSAAATTGSRGARVGSADVRARCPGGRRRPAGLPVAGPRLTGTARRCRAGSARPAAEPCGKALHGRQAGAVAATRGPHGETRPRTSWTRHSRPRPADRGDLERERSGWLGAGPAGRDVARTRAGCDRAAGGDRRELPSLERTTVARGLLGSRNHAVPRAGYPQEVLQPDGVETSHRPTPRSHA